MNVKKILKRLILKDKEYIIQKNYFSRYDKFSFIDLKCKDQKQYEASITRWYHTIEKGMAYINYRAGFGKENIEILLKEMEEYSKKYDISEFFYQTALSTLKAYIKKNKEYGYIDDELEQRINSLPGQANEYGGVLRFNVGIPQKMNYEEMVKARHSIRHFSSKPVDIDIVKKAIDLAQFTPSACNRQGWKCYIIQNKKILQELLNNQNGNRGFGQEIDKLLLILGDLRAFNRDREVFQVFIDGGMYAMRILDSLYYKNIAACPLSAALTPEQEKNVRNILDLDDAEVLIMYIGIGNYPDNCQTTRSQRHNSNTIII